MESHPWVVAGGLGWTGKKTPTAGRSVAKAWEGRPKWLMRGVG